MSNLHKARGALRPRTAAIALSRLLGSGAVVVAALFWGLCSAGTSSPGDLVVATRIATQVVAGGTTEAGPLSEPQVCTGCDPPLVYQGGPVMSTHASAGLTVTLIFWEPGGRRYVFPVKYESIIEGYIANVAAASGSADNVYSLGTEYYEVVHGAQTHITYDIRVGATVIDTDAFPPSGCTPGPGYTECISDAQLRAELGRITTNLRLPTDLAHFYGVFFPPGVETVDVDGSNSASGYCGYHRAFGSGASQTVYADLPYDRTGCNAGQEPNGDLAADGEVSTLSHELMDAITGPLSSQRAWSDGAGDEIADICSQTYGRALGSTSASDPAGTEYNQVINGGRYYTQQMFSNLAYAKFGLGKGCTLSQALAENPNSASAGGGGSVVASSFLEASPDALPSDGTTTSKIVVTVADSSGGGVRGDRVHFAVGLEDGTGLCGELSSTEETTNGNGEATVAYTASKFNVSCWVLATDAADGRAAESVIYQGTTQKARPALTAALPVSLQAGARPALFTLRSSNPTPHAVGGTRLKLGIVAGTGSSGNVNADQVHLSYSTAGPKGIFTKVGLVGSTHDGNVIDAYLGPKQGAVLAGKSARTITFQLALASDVPGSKASPLVAFVAYLTQVNPASGSGSTLAETSATGIYVAAAPASNTMWFVVAAIAALVILVATIGTLIWRRRKGRRQAPSAVTMP